MTMRATYIIVGATVLSARAAWRKKSLTLLALAIAVACVAHLTTTQRVSRDEMYIGAAYSNSLNADYACAPSAAWSTGRGMCTRPNTTDGAIVACLDNRAYILGMMRQCVADYAAMRESMSASLTTKARAGSSSRRDVLNPSQRASHARTRPWWSCGYARVSRASDVYVCVHARARVR